MNAGGTMRVGSVEWMADNRVAANLLMMVLRPLQQLPPCFS